MLLDYACSSCIHTWHRIFMKRSVFFYSELIRFQNQDPLMMKLFLLTIGMYFLYSFTDQDIYTSVKIFYLNQLFKQVKILKNCFHRWLQDYYVGVIEWMNFYNYSITFGINKWCLRIGFFLHLFSSAKTNQADFGIVNDLII